jgi:hypothetical protein
MVAISSAASFEIVSVIGSKSGLGQVLFRDIGFTDKQTATFVAAIPNEEALRRPVQRDSNIHVFNNAATDNTRAWPSFGRCEQKGV